MTKKQPLLALALVMMAVLLAGCGITINGKPLSQQTDSGGGSEYGPDYVAQHLTGDYWITYRYSASGSGTGSSDAVDMTLARTSEGYYWKAFGDEILYIKNGDTYDTYLRTTADAGFTKFENSQPVTQAEMEDSFSSFTAFMTQYGEAGSGMVKAGTETVAGRSTEKYTWNASLLGISIDYAYWIDQETGVCLKYDYSMSTKSEGAGMTFECTEFKTSNVTLPAH